MINSLLLLALAGFVFTGCATSHCGKCEMAQWEYKTVRLNPGDQNFEAELNEASKGGWKLFTIVPQEATGLAGYSQYIYEHPKY